eukprot:5010693-Amphidinium_carterae.1
MSLLCECLLQKVAAQRPQCRIPAVTTAGRQFKQINASSCRTSDGYPCRCLRRGVSVLAAELEEAAAPLLPIRLLLMGVAVGPSSKFSLCKVGSPSSREVAAANGEESP